MTFDYLIEIRPFIEKLKLKQKMASLKKDFHLKKSQKIPHLTLIYNFYPKISNYKLAELIKQTATKYENLSFVYDGWDFKETEKGHVFTFKITPSEQLKEFRRELYDNIKGVIVENPKVQDFNTTTKDNFWYHTTIVTSVHEKKAKKIDKIIHNKKSKLEKFGSLFTQTTEKISHTRKPLFFPSEVVRIPILRSGKIVYEYDKFTNEVLTRRDALSPKDKKRTLSSFRHKRGIEVIPTTVKNSNQTWFISDTHFDHSNIIGYCARPFTDVQEMNRIILDNWNYTIGKDDRVYFLGDLAYHSRTRSNYWLRKLNGNIEFIRGNHDRDTRNTKTHEKIAYKGYEFLLTHDPEELPIRWKGWIIHGDKHNNSLQTFPLVNWEKKTVNVCVELINYIPISIDKIIELIENKNKKSHF